MRPGDEPAQPHGEKLLARVSEWLQRERSKAAGRSRRPRQPKSRSPPAEQPADAKVGRAHSDSVDSQSSQVSLYRLQSILEESMVQLGLGAMPQHAPKASRPRRRPASSRPALQRAASSDTDYVDGDAIVSDCDVWLDNSKMLSYTGGGVGGGDAANKEREAWLGFKNDIIRTAHTLRLKGWRRVPLGSGDSVAVERLSGALTNAVYVVTPPPDVPACQGKKPPTKVLLRIYGPQIEHLIDRDNELKVLQRLARKKIGPRLLGTFRNGRFEQFFNAITLRPTDLRDPDTSRQIAKRTRELHDGIELLPQERDAGPGVWKNWDQWQGNMAKIITYLDKQLESTTGADERGGSVIHAWKARGYVCGVPWAQFRDAVARYRAHLNGCYKDQRAVKERLVFAHNDTQYGNILRIRPDDEKSPLLQAVNKHKQLVVIDFEYAAANTLGLEFANHFTEWTYNYHDAAAPYACSTDRYPTPEEQRRFIKAYVDHRPQFLTACATPRLRPADSGSSLGSSAPAPSLVTTASSSSIADFMLDSRAPPGGWGAAERDRERKSDDQVRRPVDETRLWRPANSAQWVAWGIVQASVPGLNANKRPLPADAALRAEEDAGANEFDYLSYAQDRALFFWGDELPESLRAQLKLA